MKQWIDAHFEEHKSLLKTFAAIPAPSRHEDARVRFLTELFENMGVKAFTDDAKNVIVPMGLELGGPMCVFSAHIDVVFPDMKPLPVREENGFLYAPGIGDDSANVCALITIIRYIKEMGLKPKAPVVFVFNTCEEGLGNLDGIRMIMRADGGPIKQLVSFDCAFEEGMIVKAVGSERWRVTVKTPGGHSYVDFGRPSAIHELARLITKLVEIPVSDDESKKTTFNVGLIEGGTSINTIAPSASMLYEYRSVDFRMLRSMRDEFLKLVEDSRKDGVEITAELIGERPCDENLDKAAQEALIEKCGRAVESVLGRSPERNSGSTDANIPLSLGIPAVTFGLYSGGGMHTREEWLEIESMRPGLLIGLTLVLETCF